jgi:hypothetical protein
MLPFMQLSGLNGFYNPKDRHNIKWNRTANIKGGPLGNIGLDLLNEFLNNRFKGKALDS